MQQQQPWPLLWFLLWVDERRTCWKQQSLSAPPPHYQNPMGIVFIFSPDRGNMQGCCCIFPPSLFSFLRVVKNEVFTSQCLATTQGSENEGISFLEKNMVKRKRHLSYKYMCTPSVTCLLLGNTYTNSLCRNNLHSCRQTDPAFKVGLKGYTHSGL